MRRLLAVPLISPWRSAPRRAGATTTGRPAARPRRPAAARTSGSRRRASSVASDIPYAPFEYTEPGLDEAIGFDVDLVNAIAASLGITKYFVKPRFDTIILRVRQGRFDMSASSFSITPGAREADRLRRPLLPAPTSP